MPLASETTNDSWELANDKTQRYYSPIKGIYPCKLNIFTEHINHFARKFFRILDNSSLVYALFAGQSIGLLRNKQNIPWVDDYDIIVPVYLCNYIEKQLLPVLLSEGFLVKKIRGGIQIYDEVNYFRWKQNNSNSCYFQCDVFYSYINSLGFLKNINGWGRYHDANIPLQVVFPFRRHLFQGMYLPFFNNVKEEVKLSYGKDTIKNAIYTTHHKITQGRHGPWKKMYKEFNDIIKIARINTISYIHSDKNTKTQMTNWYIGTGRQSLQDIFHIDKPSEAKILQFIYSNKIKLISLIGGESIEFIMLYSASIRFYLPNVKMELFLGSANNVNILPYLCYIHKVYVRSKSDEQHLSQSTWITDTTPLTQVVHLKIITFGTFDLFHKGHKNVLLHCQKYSDHVVVGVSTDQFTQKKKNIKPTDSYEKRCRNVISNGASTVFAETDMNKKEVYIKENNAELLLMGDDWQDKFDNLSIRVIYIPRTSNISSTMLRNKKI